jgi:hypothetical protein
MIILTFFHLSFDLPLSLSTIPYHLSQLPNRGTEINPVLKLGKDKTGLLSTSGFINYDPQAKSGFPPGFVNKVLLEHSHVCLLTNHPQVLLHPNSRVN